MNKNLKGTMIASAVASLFLAAPALAGDDMHGKQQGGVKCMGGNACKGQGACGTADHACAGMNSCKGKGWIMTTTAEECTKKGGTVAK